MNNTMTTNNNNTLLHEALDAYLSPLLSCHASSVPLLHDDLLSSYQAAQKVVLKQQKRNNNNGARLVSKQIEELHNSQLQAYEQAARTAIQQYSKTLMLPSYNGCVVEQHVEACCKLFEQNKPQWIVNDDIWNECGLEPIKERARQQAKAAAAAVQSNNHASHAVEVSSDNATDEEENHEDEEEEDNDEDEEQAEEDEEDGDSSLAAVTQPKKRKLRKKAPANNKGNKVRKVAAGGSVKTAMSGVLGAPRGGRGRKAGQTPRKRGGRGGGK